MNKLTTLFHQKNKKIIEKAGTWETRPISLKSKKWRLNKENFIHNRRDYFLNFASYKNKLCFISRTVSFAFYRINSHLMNLKRNATVTASYGTN